MSSCGGSTKTVKTSETNFERIGIPAQSIELKVREFVADENPNNVIIADVVVKNVAKGEDSYYSKPSLTLKCLDKNGVELFRMNSGGINVEKGAIKRASTLWHDDDLSVIYTKEDVEKLISQVQKIEFESDR